MKDKGTTYTHCTEVSTDSVWCDVTGVRTGAVCSPPQWFREHGHDTTPIGPRTQPNYLAFSNLHKLPLWTMEAGDNFHCNGTNYTISEEFSCFGRIPGSTFPYLQHCHGWVKAGVVCWEVVVYILLYATLVALYKLHRLMKSLMRRVSSGPAKEELPIKIKGSLINDVETV
eukprot:sb/3472164/